MSPLPEPLLWILIAVALIALVVSLTAAARQVLGRHSADRTTRVRLQRMTMIASGVGMLALGTITIANLVSRA